MDAHDAKEGGGRATQEAKAEERPMDIVFPSIMGIYSVASGLFILLIG
ncbi:MAG: hypothetical protein O7D86_02720 [Proteobacteria bacterium]|nr:hypothetical protein [Pseudomonadota bacterium]